MDQKPKNRRADGIDCFLLEKAARELLKEMESNGWNRGEVEQFPKYLEGAIKANNKRLEATRPFVVAEIN